MSIMRFYHRLDLGGCSRSEYKRWVPEPILKHTGGVCLLRVLGERTETGKVEI